MKIAVVVIFVVVDVVTVIAILVVVVVTVVCGVVAVIVMVIIIFVIIVDIVILIFVSIVVVVYILYYGYDYSSSLFLYSLLKLSKIKCASFHHMIMSLRLKGLLFIMSTRHLPFGNLSFFLSLCLLPSFVFPHPLNAIYSSSPSPVLPPRAAIVTNRRRISTDYARQNNVQSYMRGAKAMLPWVGVCFPFLPSLHHFPAFWWVLPFSSGFPHFPLYLSFFRSPSFSYSLPLSHTLSSVRMITD